MKDPAMVTGTITITHYIASDGDDRVAYELDGDAEHAVTALGLLAMTQDSILHADDDGDDQ